MPRSIDIIAAIRDPRLINDPEVSPAQETLLRAIDGLPLIGDEQLDIFRRATGRAEYQPQAFRDASILSGRRGGKTVKICANVAVKEACIAKHPIPAGERGVVVVIAPVEKQARITFGIIRSKIDRSPTLSKLVTNIRAGQTESEIQLSNSVDIVVSAANAKHVRGANYICAILEEAAFFRDSETGAYNLGEIIKAIRPGMLTLPDSKLIRVSSPWAKFGPMYDDFRLRDDRPQTMSWKLPSWEMNPSLPEDELKLERERDPDYFAREYGCEFAEAEEALIPAADVDAAIRVGVRETPPTPSNRYYAAIDASGLGGRDRFAFMIGHAAVKGNSGPGLSLNAVRYWSRDSVARVLEEIAILARSYRVHSITCDQFGFSYLKELLKQRGLEAVQMPFTVRSKGEIFIKLKTDFVQRRIQLLDHSQLRRELVFLEARRTGSGNVSISGARNEYDDLACCLALLNHAVDAQRSSGGFGFLITSGPGGAGTFTTRTR
jgi:hypothetical protein